MSNGSQPTGIGEILRELIGRDEPLISAILLPWKKALGEKLANMCIPISLTEGTLVVKVESSAWGTQLRFLEKEIISNLNREMEREIVRKIKIVGGSLPKTEPGRKRKKS